MTESAEVTPLRPFPRATRRLVVLLLAPCAVLFAAELSLALWARHVRLPYEAYDETHGTPILVPGRYETPHGIVEIDERGFVARAAGPSAPETPARRIVALGDSCTFGAGEAQTTYPAALERRLHGSGVEVVNAGIAGLSSDEAMGRLDYAIDTVHPEIVVIYLGWNDLMKRSPRAQTRAAWLSGLGRAIDDRWLVRAARKLLFFHLRSRLVAPRTGSAGETGRFTDFRPDYFEENLRHLVATARRAGVRPVLVTLPHSLRRSASPMESSSRRWQYPYFLGGNALGDFIDLIERYDEAIERVGREEGVPVADLAARFEHIERKEDYFFDTLHPNVRGNELIAEVLFQTLRAQGMLDDPRAHSTVGSED